MSSIVSALKNALIGLVVVGLITAALAWLAPALLGDLSNLTAERLAALAGVVMALALDKLVFLSNWFNGLDSIGKSWATAGSVVGIGIALFALSCAGVLGAALAIVCSVAGAFELLALILQALLGSQAAYLIFIKPRKRA